MARRTSHSLPDPLQVMLESFAVNERMNQFLIRNLDHRLWAAKPPGKGTRTIVAIFSHVHNVRRKWVRLSAPQLRLPDSLAPTRWTRRQASAALAASARCCLEMIRRLLESQSGRTFLRDGWASPWPPGAATVIYMISHEAHHRGQILMLARQLGKPLPRSLSGQIWNWEKLWKQAGFTRPR